MLHLPASHSPQCRDSQLSVSSRSSRKKKCGEDFNADGACSRCITVRCSCSPRIRELNPLLPGGLLLRAQHAHPPTQDRLRAGPASAPTRYKPGARVASHRQHVRSPLPVVPRPSSSPPSPSVPRRPRLDLFCATFSTSSTPPSDSRFHQPSRLLPLLALLPSRRPLTRASLSNRLWPLLGPRLWSPRAIRTDARVGTGAW